jgi:hypothetical protein
LCAHILGKETSQRLKPDSNGTFYKNFTPLRKRHTLPSTFLRIIIRFGFTHI